MDNCTDFTVPRNCEIIPAQEPNGTDNYKSEFLIFEPNNLDSQPLPASLDVSFNGICGVLPNGTQTEQQRASPYCCSHYRRCGNTFQQCLPSSQILRLQC